jgi:hypothetical protein
MASRVLIVSSALSLIAFLSLFFLRLDKPAAEPEKE